MALHVIVGKGPVGMTTAEELVSRGHEVRVLSRSGGRSTEAIEHRQVPVEKHHVGVAGANRFQRGEAVHRFDNDAGAQIHQHAARQSPHELIAVGDQDVEALDHAVEMAAAHRFTP